MKTPTESVRAVLLFRISSKAATNFLLFASPVSSSVLASTSSVTSFRASRTARERRPNAAKRVAAAGQMANRGNVCGKSAAATSNESEAKMASTSGIVDRSRVGNCRVG